MKIGIGGKIILSIELAVLLVSVLAGLATYFIMYRGFEEQTYTHLESIVTLKENSLRGYLDEAVTSIEYFTNRKTVRELLLSYISDKSSDNKKALLEKIQELLAYKKIFIGTSLLDHNGEIILSTNEADEGKYRSAESYFLKSKEKTYIQDYYYDAVARQHSLIVATPIKDSQGNFLGVLAARIDTESINTIMSERSGMGLTGESFLVNSSHLYINELLKEQGAPFKKTNYLPQVNSCLEGRSGRFNQPDYHGDMVFGYYRWIPSINSCLLAKIDRSEALVPINQEFLVLTLVLLIGGLLMGFTGYLQSKSIVKPIKRLHESMVEVKEKNLYVKTEVISHDEVGEMAETFNEMVGNLESYRTSLEEKVKEKTLSLEEKMTELEEINKLMVGRELVMIDLKKKLKEKNG